MEKYINATRLIGVLDSAIARTAAVKAIRT